MAHRHAFAAITLLAVLSVALAGCISITIGPTAPVGTSTPGPSEASRGYLCDSLLTPETSQDGRPGFTTPLLGRSHVRDPNTVIDYAFCPPTSGDHFNITNLGPIRPAVYPPNEEQRPGGWLANLEHGYVVVLYRCPSGVIGEDDCISQAEVEQLQAFYEDAPDSLNPSCPTKLVVARFDSISTRFALLAWGRALLTDAFDPDTALQFNEQWNDQPAVPERGLC
jgi:hypothetical protein